MRTLFDRNAVLDRLENIPRATADAGENAFPPVSLGNGRVLTSPDRFTAAGAEALVDVYLEAYNNLRESEQTLAHLRDVYAAGDHSVAADIRAAEAALPGLRRALITRRNALIRSALRH